MIILRSTSSSGTKRFDAGHRAERILLIRDRAPIVWPFTGVLPGGVFAPISVLDITHFCVLYYDPWKEVLYADRNGPN
jgi:hypothetical protein